MKAVVFDMDGVLFDTEIVCMKAWMAVAERRGLSGMEEIFNQVIGLNANDSRLIVLKAYGEDFDYPGFRQEAAEFFQKDIRRTACLSSLGCRRFWSGSRAPGTRWGWLPPPAANPC